MTLITSIGDREAKKFLARIMGMIARLPVTVQVLGVLESGVDFEKRINEIIQNCRTSEQINAAFDQLQSELEEKIAASIKDARTKLLENFDEEVQQKLRLRRAETKTSMSRYGEWLWRLTCQELAGCAAFDLSTHCFNLQRLPDGLQLPAHPPGKVPARHGRRRKDSIQPAEDEHQYRAGHPLAAGGGSCAKDAICRFLRSLSITATTRGKSA